MDAVIIAGEDRFVSSLAQVLGKAGFDARAASNPARLVELCRGEPALAIVLSEPAAGGPNGTGIVNLKRVVQKPLAPVLIVRGGQPTQDASSLLAAGAAAVFVAPSQLGALIERLRAMSNPAGLPAASPGAAVPSPGEAPPATNPAPAQTPAESATEGLQPKPSAASLGEELFGAVVWPRDLPTLDGARAAVIGAAREKPLSSGAAGQAAVALVATLNGAERAALQQLAPESAGPLVSSLGADLVSEGASYRLTPDDAALLVDGAAHRLRAEIAARDADTLAGQGKTVEVDGPGLQALLGELDQVISAFEKMNARAMREDPTLLRAYTAATNALHRARVDADNAGRRFRGERESVLDAASIVEAPQAPPSPVKRAPAAPPRPEADPFRPPAPQVPRSRTRVLAIVAAVVVVGGLAVHVFVLDTFGLFRRSPKLHVAFPGVQSALRFHGVAPVEVLVGPDFDPVKSAEALEKQLGVQRVFVASPRDQPIALIDGPNVTFYSHRPSVPNAQDRAPQGQDTSAPGNR